ncbi:MAG: hypothetical protein NVV59_15860 [Chitinophagaceae bacterium]|nr:hypothetical protein [Chitinophagaceae bacterium]
MIQRNPAISKGIDWSLIGIFVLLAGIGIMAIFGATYKEGDPIVQSFLNFKTDYSKQLYFFGIGVVLGLFILLTDSKFFFCNCQPLVCRGDIYVVACIPVGYRCEGYIVDHSLWRIQFSAS